MRVAFLPPPSGHGHKRVSAMLSHLRFWTDIELHSDQCFNCVFTARPRKYWAEARVLRQHYASTAPASSSDILSSKSMEAIATLQLAELDKLVEKARIALDNLLQIRAQVATAVRGCAAVRSPIRTLPRDILITIFQYCVPWTATPDNWDSYPEDSLDTRPGRMPWTLAQVSRRWREEAISYGPLWSVITLPCDYASGKKIVKTSVLLLRSKEADLSVKIVEVDDCIHSTDPTAPGMCKLRFSPAVAARCKRLLLPYFLSLGKQQLDFAFPRLTSFFVDYESHAASLVETGPASHCIDAPLLHHYGEYTSNPEDTLAVTQEHIPRYTFTRLMWVRLLDFKLAPFRKLTLIGTDDPTGATPELNFPYLEDVCLQDTDVAQFFGRARMPNLKKLHIETPIPRPGFTSTFLAPPAYLTHLTLTHEISGVDDVAQSLRAMLVCTNGLENLQLFLQIPAVLGRKVMLDLKEVIQIISDAGELLPWLGLLWINVNLARVSVRRTRRAVVALCHAKTKKVPLRHFGLMDKPGVLRGRWKSKDLEEMKEQLAVLVPNLRIDLWNNGA